MTSDDSSGAFVNVHKVFVDYEQQVSVVGRLSGKRPSRHSAVRNVSFSLPHGTHVTVYGAEGAGKTTLLRTLAGALKPTAGRITINGKKPLKLLDNAAGYVSLDETEPTHQTPYQALEAFAQTHGIEKYPAKVSEIADVLKLGPFLHRETTMLSTGERTRLNLARAALSQAPVILLDDTADILGPQEIKRALVRLWLGKTVIIATRFPATAEELGAPLLILHHGSLAEHGTLDELAEKRSCNKTLDVWIEGLRYDLLRRLRKHPGVTDVRLLSNTDFAGQKITVTVHSPRYLPSVYDLLSQAPIVRIEEQPPLLSDILEQL